MAQLAKKKLKELKNAGIQKGQDRKLIQRPTSGGAKFTFKRRGEEPGGGEEARTQVGDGSRGQHGEYRGESDVSGEGVRMWRECLVLECNSS